MKKCILLLLFAWSLCGVMQAEELESEAVAPKPSISGFVSNKFGDNWELSVGGGIAGALGSGQKPAGSRAGYEVNIAATKWLHPALGVRLQLQGGQFRNYNDQYGQRGWLMWPYIYAHVDAMGNLSNLIGGYKENRVYNAVLFAGMGYMASNFTKAAQEQVDLSVVFSEYAFTYGLLNKFRVSKSIDINLELKGMLSSARNTTPANDMKSSFLNGLSASVGVSYRFKERGFKRSITGYTVSDIERMQNELAENKTVIDSTETENQTLKEQLAQVQKQVEEAERKMAEMVAANEVAKSSAVKTESAAKNADMESVIFFDYGMAQLSSTDMTRLQFVADQIKKGPQEKVYTVFGYADKQTGQLEFNKRLAQKRAKCVYDYLVKCGVAESQLQCDSSIEQSYQDTAEGNRATVIIH